MLKHQQFKNTKSDKTEPKGSKRWQLDLRDNKERKSLNKFKDKGDRKNIGYILFLFIISPQKKSNCLTNMGKRIKSLNYLI